jgi:hypothetical protein
MSNITIPEISSIRKAICDVAKRYSRERRFIIHSSTRQNLDTGKIAMNISEISADPDWNDTDLFDNSHRFEEFADHLQTFPAVFDFWVYEPHESDRNDHGDLVTNAQAKFPGNGTVEIWDGADHVSTILLKSC